MGGKVVEGEGAGVPLGVVGKVGGDVTGGNDLVGSTSEDDSVGAGVDGLRVGATVGSSTGVSVGASVGDLVGASVTCVGVDGCLVVGKGVCSTGAGVV